MKHIIPLAVAMLLSACFYPGELGEILGHKDVYAPADCDSEPVLSAPNIPTGADSCVGQIAVDAQSPGHASAVTPSSGGMTPESTEPAPPPNLGVLTADNREGSISVTASPPDEYGWTVYTLRIVEGYTEIGDKAFYRATPADFGISGDVDYPLYKLIIPDGVTRIGDSAFENPGGGIISIEFPDTLVYIGPRAFRHSGGWPQERLVIPDSVREIGEMAFASASVKSLTLGSGVERIGDYAFYLHEIPPGLVIPASVKSLGERAFEPQIDYYIEHNGGWVDTFTLKAANAFPSDYDPEKGYSWDGQSWTVE